MFHDLWFKIKRKVVKLYIALQNGILFVIRYGIFESETRIEPRSILIYRTARLGDFITAIPALAIIRNRFPSARIVLLTTISTMSEVLLNTKENQKKHEMSYLPWLTLVEPSIIDEAVVIPMRNWYLGLQKARRRIYNMSPDMTFILPFSGEDGINRAKKMLFLWLAGARNPIYGIRINSTYRYLREIQYQNHMFEHQVWGPIRAIMECSHFPEIEEKDVIFPLSIDIAAEIWLQKLWETRGWHGKQALAVSPGGTFAHKRWPTEKFVEICRLLQKQHNYVIILVGDDDDKITCYQVFTQLNNEMSIDLAGQTTIMQLAAVLKRCCIFIGNDGGSAHMASAVGCPCVTIFSSIVYSGVWEPWNSRESAIHNSVPCEYCFSYKYCPTGTMACIRDISVDRVMDCVGSIISNK